MSNSPTGPSSRKGIETKSDGGQKFREGGLCEACQGVDFESYFKRKVAHQSGIPVRALRGIPQNWAASACRLCRFFADVCLRDESCDQYHLRLFDSYRLLHPTSYHKAITKRPRSTVLGVVPGPLKGKGKKFTSSFVTSLNLIAPLAKDTEMPKSPAIRARPVDIFTPNYKLIRSSLNACCLSHDQQVCARPTNNRREGELNMLLVDCHELKVIDGHSGMRYFALSFVWGKPTVNVQELEASEQRRLLSSRQLPKTFNDAITVVTKMGERFLWVDMLCISKNNKAAQIQQMHKIYEEALATLVAVEGDDVDHGIMGISCPRTRKQAIVHTKGGNVASIAQSLHVMLRASKWSQRAWTFQETVLSRRCIYFTSAQVYFACRSGTTCETLSGSGRLAYSLGPELFERFDKFDGFALPSQRQRSLLDFWKQLSIYTRRDLKLEEDALNAYMGVLSCCSYTTYWGIAVVFERVTPIGKSNFVTGAYEQDVIPINESKCFGIGLLWLCADPHVPRIQVSSTNRSRTMIMREVGFPSWAWASIRMYASCSPEPFTEPFSLATRLSTTRGEAIKLQISLSSV